MPIPIVRIYRSVASTGQIPSFDIQVQGQQFFLFPAQPGLTPIDSISRVDFLDPDGNILLVVPCFPTESSINPANGGQVFEFRLELRNFLGGGPIVFQTDLQSYQRPGGPVGMPYKPQIAPCLPNSGAAPQPGFQLAGKFTNPPGAAWSTDLSYYVSVIQDLPGYKKFDDGARVDAPQDGSFDPAVSSRPLYSQHTSVLVRWLRTDKDVLPLLCPRRAYQMGPNDPAHIVLLPPPFSFSLPTGNGGDAAAHVSQFPAISWFDSADSSTSLPEADIWHFETSSIPSDQAQSCWFDRVLKPYIVGLRLINTPLPVSMAASIKWAPEAAAPNAIDDTWRLFRAALLRPADKNGNRSLLALSERLLPGGYLDSDTKNAVQATWNVTGEFPGFRTHNGTPLQFSAVMYPFANQDLKDTGNDEQPTNHPPKALAPRSSMLFNLRGTKLTSAPPARVRLGSLDLTFGFWSDDDRKLNPDIDELIFRVDFDPPVVPVASYQDLLNPGGFIPRVYVQGTLPVASYAPGGQDELPNDNEFQITAGPGVDINRSKFVRSAPIVIDASLVGADAVPQDSAPATCKLKFDERTLPSPQQQQIVLNLQQLRGSALLPRVLVLDREPFLVAFVSLQPSASEGLSLDPALANNIGVWCNLYPEGAGWRLQAGSGGFNLYLPPQALGEGMVRGFFADDLFGPDGSPRSSPETQPNPALIDYRFSTLLFARLHANFFAQNAVEPGWNTRRVFGTAGQQLPGALVDDQNGGITFALYYGMTAAVSQPNLRLSEIFARLGNFPGPLPDPGDQSGFALPFTSGQSSVYAKASTDWADLYSQLLRRLAALELWDDHQGPDLVIDENVDFTLLPQALDQNPGFYGNLAYAIDSKNIVGELLAGTKSVAGQVNSPRFTALGGYGTQRAEFANGKVIIDTRTSMGRIESLTITLAGRIGNLWNHALHVTVYARTVLPSDQFALYQDPLYYRPLLRKTEEYVLITEASRLYPENSAADPALAGFVLGSTFKSIKINVDSRWGGDIGQIGWQVPLWQKGALPKIVYPRPHIAFKVAVDPATGSSAVLGEIDDPEKLCFYTDTRTKTTADTDSWPVVPEIDWIDQPGTAPDGSGPAFQDPSIEPGFGRFTYHFADAPAQVNIVAQRTTTAVTASLSNVSMMRGQRSAPAGNSGEALTVPQRVRRVSDWWTSARTHLECAAEETDALFASATQVANDAGQVAANAAISAGKSAQDIQTAVDQAKTKALADIRDKATKKLTGALNDVQQTYLGNPTVKSVASDLTNLAQAPTAACDAVKARLDSAFSRVDQQGQNILQTVLQSFPAQLKADLGSLRRTLTQGNIHDPQAIASAANAAIDAAVKSFQITIAPATGAPFHVASVIDAYVPDLNVFSAAVVKAKTALTALQPDQPGQAAITAALTAIQDIMPAAAAVPGASTATARALLNRDAADILSAANLLTGGRGTQLVFTIDGALDAYLKQLGIWLNAVDIRYRQALQPASVLLDKLLADIQTAIHACTTASQQLKLLAQQPPFTLITDMAATLEKQITAAAAVSEAEVNRAIDTCVDIYLTTVTDATSWAKNFVQQQENWINLNVDNLCNTFKQDITGLLNGLSNMATSEFQSLMQNFIYGPDGLVADTATFRNGLASISSQFENQLQQATRSLTQEVQSIATGAAGEALRVIRAFGDPPHVPTMAFAVPPIPLPNIGDISLPAMAYCFNDALPTVDMTPARAVVQQLADGLGSLSQLGVNLPTRQMLDRLLPDSLQNFDFTSILPHFAGIDLTSLLSGVRMPSVANDSVHITHHVDPQARRASLDADIHVPLAGNSTLFDLGPVELRLVDAEFDAQVHCEVTVGQQVQQTSSGQISGDWELLICGMSVVGFTKTTLSFDSSGKVHFDIKPANVRLSEVLQFLADLVNSLNLGDGGFALHMTTTPIAVQCILDLPLPDMSAGAFGVQNLRLGATFELGYDQSFYLSVAANLARETAPFILTVFVLGGAGWIEAAMRYQDGKVTGLITIGLAASASLAISLGPISGSVSIEFGIFAKLAIGSGGGFQLGIMLLIDGRVSILGFVEANIMLLLEAEYSSGGGLTGRGVVSVSIKICWCFTLEVHTGVQFTFGSAGGSKPAEQQQSHPQVAAAIAAPVALAGGGAAPPAAPDPPNYEKYRDAAIQYVTMLA